MNNWKTCPKCGGEFLRLSYHPASDLCHHCYRRPKNFRVMDAIEFLVGKTGMNAYMQFGKSIPGDIGIILSIEDDGNIFVASNGFLYRCNKDEIKKTSIKNPKIGKLENRLVDPLKSIANFINSIESSLGEQNEIVESA